MSTSVRFLLFFLLCQLVGIISAAYHLNSDHNGTYGSDAQYYFISSLNASLNSCQDYLAPGFVCLLSGFLLFTPTNDHFWIVIFNVTLYSISVFIVYSALMRTAFFSKTIFFILALNPVILWAIVRGLKESIVILSISVLIYLLSYCRINTKILIFIIISAMIMDSVKPDGFLLVMLSVITAWLLTNYVKLTFFRSLFFVFVPLLILNYIVETKIFELAIIQHRTLALADEGFSSSFAADGSILISIIRFILGPGPIKAIYQIINGDQFQVSTFFGDVLILLGSLQWWLTLLFIGFIVFKNINVISNYILNQNPSLFSIIFCYYYIVSYSVAYSGTGDTRHRAVMYFVLIPVFTIILSNPFQKSKIH